MIITAATITASVLLAHVVAGVITDPAARTLEHWSTELWLLLALWVIRVAAHWAQGRLSQHGATAVIADLSGQLLRAVTARSPRQLALERDDAAAVVTRGLDGLRPYFTAYVPAVVLAAILTP
ncbi:hypothetical protein ACN269_33165, partial [Micromonospora sp. WMMD736]